MASLDEASRCPKCLITGEKTSSTRGAKGSTVYTYTCRNERCKWLNTPWIVQVLANGEIPERKPGMKEYPILTEGQKSVARRQLEQLEFETTGEEPRRQY